eukprot:scpid93494/ scgid15496/ 
MPCKRGVIIHKIDCSTFSTNCFQQCSRLLPNQVMPGAQVILHRKELAWHQQLFSPLHTLLITTSTCSCRICPTNYVTLISAPELFCWARVRSWKEHVNVDQCSKVD